MFVVIACFVNSDTDINSYVKSIAVGCETEKEILFFISAVFLKIRMPCKKERGW